MISIVSVSDHCLLLYSIIKRMLHTFENSTFLLLLSRLIWYLMTVPTDENFLFAWQKQKEEERNRQVLTYLYLLTGGICAGVIVAIYIYLFLVFEPLPIVIEVKS